MRPSPILLSSFTLLLVLIASPAVADVVVVEVAPPLAGAAAGLSVGDRIGQWQHELGSGSLDDPLTLELLEIEMMPRGLVTLIGERDGEATSWRLGPTPWGISIEADPANPRDQSAEALAAAVVEAEDPVTAALLSLNQSHALEAVGDRPRARGAAEQGLERLRASGEERPLVEAQLLERVGVVARRLSDLDAAEAALEVALAIRREQIPGSYYEGQSLYDLHLCAFTRGQLELAGELGDGALAIYEALPGSEFIAAQIRSKIGRVSLQLGQHDVARQRFESSLEVFLRLDPDGPDVGESYTNLGILARRSGDLAGAEDRFLSALAIYEAIDPNSGAVAMLMNNLGAVAFDRGDIMAAEYYIGRALEMRQGRDPDSIVVAMYLNNVASMAFERGNLAKAERLYLQALAIREVLAPESLDAALSNENLGSVCFERGDLERSGVYFEAALAMIRASAPGSADEARILRNMGQLASRRGDLELALQLHEQSLAIRSQLSPGGIDEASSLAGLADVNRQLGNYDVAEQQLQRAIAIDEAIAPGGLTVAGHYGLLAAVYLEAGDAEGSLEVAQRSLELREELVPESYWEAISWNNVGEAQRAAGRWEPALAAFVNATELMDRQDPSVGEIESSRMRFRARHADLYRNCIDARVQLDDLDGALEDLERSRARSFLTMLGERDLQFTADLPSELLARRRRNRTEYDRTLSALTRVKPTEDPEAVEELTGELATLSEERDRIAAEVRRLSPELDALERPRTLTAAEIVERIPANTVFITYSVGPGRTHGLVVHGGRGEDGATISSFTQAIDREDLAARVRAFRGAIQYKDAYEAEAAELYRLLIEPATASIAAADRVLLSPDGPLHLLPFAALQDPDGENAGRFLMEWRPLHFTSSVAVYAELNRVTPPAAEGEIVVFADPAAPGSMVVASASTSGEGAMDASSLRSLAGGARELGSLEFAREEATAIEELYGSNRTTLLLGSEASEARAKQLSGRLALAHFACHGLADQVDPLNSALILGDAPTPELPGENGFLQSWEILESLRFEAELVTLSACETAVGADMGGEGLVSLVRSFQYAGAAAVLASLWQVADRPTARLMEEFYHSLEAGQSKDQALRTAQKLIVAAPVEAAEPSTARGVGGLSEGGSGAHPFYWAAFQLYGSPSPRYR